MADLKTLLKQGSLKKTSEEELQNLSQKAGLNASPLSPQGAASIGASPDQAKMAGSSASKAVSLQTSQGDLSLRDTLRREPTAATATEEQKKKQTQQETLGRFTGSLDERVQKLAEQTLGGQASFTLKPQINPEKISVAFPQVAPEKQGEVGAAANKLLETPGDLESARVMAEALGLNTENYSADQLITAVNKAMRVASSFGFFEMRSLASFASKDPSTI